MIDPIIPKSKNIKHDLIFQDEFVCAFKKSHPIAKQKNLSMETFLDLKQVNISNRRKGPSLIDVELEKVQLKRNIVLRAQHFMVTPEIIKSSDYVLVSSKSFAVNNGLSWKKLPISLPKVEQHLMWHASDDNDGSHIWMRELIRKAFLDLV